MYPSGDLSVRLWRPRLRAITYHRLLVNKRSIIFSYDRIIMKKLSIQKELSELAHKKYDF